MRITGKPTTTLTIRNKQFNVFYKNDNVLVTENNELFLRLEKSIDESSTLEMVKEQIKFKLAKPQALKKINEFENFISPSVDDESEFEKKCNGTITISFTYDGKTKSLNLPYEAETFDITDNFIDDIKVYAMDEYCCESFCYENGIEYNDKN